MYEYEDTRIKTKKKQEDETNEEQKKSLNLYKVRA